MTRTADVLLVRLADVIANGPDDQEPAPGFVANLHCENVEVTAVLQRTAVVAPLRDRWADKQLVRLPDLLVDPTAITWRPKAMPTGFQAKLRRPYRAEQRQALRAASDRRARADQARAAAPEPGARPAATPRRAAPPPPQPDAGTKTTRPVAAAASPRAATASAITEAPPPAAAKVQQPALAAELQRAHQRIAELEAELERHRAVALHVVRRLEVVVGRRAA